MEWIRNAVITILVFGAIYWFALEARWAKSSIRNGYREYPMPKLLKLVFVTAIPAMLYGAVANLLRRDGEIWVSVLLILLSLFCLYFMPATILCSPKRLVSIKWFGLRKLILEWPDVVSVYSNPEDNSLVVRDKYDNTIAHSMYNIGRAEFIEQVKSLPYNFSRKL